MSSLTSSINRLSRVTPFKLHHQTCFFWTWRTFWAMLSSRLASSERSSRGSTSKRPLMISSQSNNTKLNQRKSSSQQTLLGLKPSKEPKISMATKPRTSQSSTKTCQLSLMRRGSSKFSWIFSQMLSSSPRMVVPSTFHANWSEVCTRIPNHRSQSWKESSTIHTLQMMKATNMSIWVLIRITQIF